jgi:hypothetical protein
MLSHTIQWSCIALECFLLARGLRGRLLARYPIFYGYIFFVVAQSILRFIVHRWYNEQVYTPVYWATEFLGLLVGSLIVFEIYQVALAAYPGTARIARRILLLLFAIALARAGATFAGDPHLLSRATPLQIERALRTMQAISIAALVAVFAAYSIPFGKNLRGILLGYGLFVGERVICLAFVPTRGEDFWFYAYSASYIAALGLWLQHLWAYQANPALQPVAQLDREYQLIAARTRRRLQDARGYLRKAAGS